MAETERDGDLPLLKASAAAVCLNDLSKQDRIGHYSWRLCHCVTYIFVYHAYLRIMQVCAMSNQTIDARLLRPGTIVKVQIRGLFGLYWHFGVVSDVRDWSGLPFVISNSSANGGVTEDDWETFSGGHECKIVGFPSSLSSSQVIANARRLSARRYNLVSWDCERFAKACHGLAPRSSQLEMTLLAAFAGLLLFAAQN